MDRIEHLKDWRKKFERQLSVADIDFLIDQLKKEIKEIKDMKTENNKEWLKDCGGTSLRCGVCETCRKIKENEHRMDNMQKMIESAIAQSLDDCSINLKVDVLAYTAKNLLTKFDIGTKKKEKI